MPDLTFTPAELEYLDFKLQRTGLPFDLGPGRPRLNMAESHALAEKVHQAWVEEKGKALAASAGSGRTRFFKASTATLTGPHYGGLTYLPGTEHREASLDLDTSKSCAVGLYYTSHIRVAGRWGPVILQVTRLGAHVRTDAQVKGEYGRNKATSGSYRKYRTDHLRVEKVVAVVGYSLSMGERGAWDDAQTTLLELNRTLARNGHPVLRLTGNILQRLRTKPGQAEQYLVYEVEEVR